MLRRITLPVLLAIAALGCDALRIETNVGGRVVDGGGKPIDAVLVKLVAVNYEPAFTAPKGRLPPINRMKAVHRAIGYAMTDGDGGFNFESVDLSSGPSACKFFVEACKAGYEDDALEVVLESDRNRLGDLVLTKRAE